MASDPARAALLQPPARPITGRDPAAMSGVYRRAERAAILGLLANFLLAGAKLAAGILGQSFALIADAINSMGDVVSSTVVLGALRFAQRPPDEEHPYGHTRIEAIAGAIVSVLIISSAAIIGWEAVRRLPEEHGAPPAWTFWVAGGTVLLKELLYHYKWRLGKQTGSQSLMANAWDHRSDALSALAVLVGLALVRYGGPDFRQADEIAALVVVAFILRAGYHLLKGSVHELMDAQAEPEYRLRVRDTAGSVAGVAGVEKLWIRKTGLEYLVDIHLEVDPELTVREGHRIGHRVKDRLTDSFPEIKEVLVHLEPAGHAREHDPPE